MTSLVIILVRGQRCEPLRNTWCGMMSPSYHRLIIGSGPTNRKSTQIISKTYEIWEVPVRTCGELST